MKYSSLPQAWSARPTIQSFACKHIKIGRLMDYMSLSLKKHNPKKMKPSSIWCTHRHPNA